MSLRLLLVDPQRSVAAALAHRFRGQAGVEVVRGKFEDLPDFDCIITAGNSFGLMDAGIDRAVVHFFGEKLMADVQERILADYLGEQPVGTCFLVETSHPQHRHVAHAPTMRTPMNIAGTDHVYSAMWAALVEIARHNRLQPTAAVRTVACPGMGTGTGGVAPPEAALQLFFAWQHFLNPPKHFDGSLAQQRQERIHFGGKWGLENPRAPELT